MICSSENRFFTSNLLIRWDWTPNRPATQNRGDVDTGRGGFRFADRQGRAATSEAQRIVLGNAAFVYNAASVPIAAGVLYPVFGLLLSPILAATAIALSSVSVICNALRLRTTKVA
ncbi:hypothetical protein [Pseudoxanthomonas mexicana]|uniref:hypothetical protein n=1 Tax=Pseudoxanthomonas mexicana TaxID=128785 RepID=UPI0028AC1767|nr:hypothetical protein [Pseudoxanthomonas mexicana]